MWQTCSSSTELSPCAIPQTCRPRNFGKVSEALRLASCAEKAPACSRKLRGICAWGQLIRPVARFEQRSTHQNSTCQEDTQPESRLQCPRFLMGASCLDCIIFVGVFQSACDGLPVGFWGHGRQRWDFWVWFLKNA